MIDLVRAYHLEEKIIFSSFNHYTVLRCKEIAPEIKCGFLTSDWIADFGAYAKSRGVECCHPWFITLLPEIVREIHAEGREINTYTVNEPEDVKRLSALGVDALIGNYPDTMIAAQKEMQA